MATYCSERDLKDVFPSVDEFDTKTSIYGWVVHSGSLYRADNCGLITLLFADGQDLGDAEANSGVVNVNGEWYYDSALDSVYYYNSASNPNDLLMESGEDWATLKTRYMANASKYLDSRLDAQLPREQFKDQDGNYDYVIIRTSALLTASFLIRASDPSSDLASALWEEANLNIESLNNGSTKLSWQVTGDSAKGSLSELGTISGALRIVDTRGEYSGIYDKIGVEITTLGRIGVATYSVWTGDSDYTGVERMDIDATANLIDEKINGQYQQLAGGLQIRFAGDIADAAALNDKWQVEVFGRQETVDMGTPGSIRMTRRSKRVAAWR
jgi:hypothetical protein